MDWEYSLRLWPNLDKCIHQNIMKKNSGYEKNSMFILIWSISFYPSSASWNPCCFYYCTDFILFFKAFVDDFSLELIAWFHVAWTWNIFLAQHIIALYILEYLDPLTMILIISAYLSWALTRGNSLKHLSSSIGSLFQLLIPSWQTKISTLILLFDDLFSNLIIWVLYK